MEQNQPSQTGSFCSLPNTHPSVADQCVNNHNGADEVKEARVLALSVAKKDYDRFLQFVTTLSPGMIKNELLKVGILSCGDLKSQIHPRFNGIYVI